MSGNSFRFTDKAVKDIKPADKRKYYHDTVLNDLMLQVTPNGAKTYYLYKRMDGQPVRYKLGNPKGMSVSTARDEAIKARAQIASGINPQKVRKDIREEDTVDKMYRKFIAEKKLSLSDSTYREYVRMWDKDLKIYFAAKKVSQITVDVIRRFHRKMADRPYYANRCVAFIKGMFNYFIREGMFKGENPARGIKFNKEEARVRYMTHEELQRFFKAINETDFSISKYAILFILFTGVRKSNALHARWEEIDLDAKIWNIPKTKTGKHITLPLADNVIELLHDLKDQNIDSPFVFPSENSASGHLEDIKRVWGTLIKRAHISNFRIHDLRHTLATYMVASGASAFEVQRALTHKSIKSSQIYVNLGVETLRGTINDTVNNIRQIAKGKPKKD